MSSSLTGRRAGGHRPPARAEGLLHVLTRVRDPRAQRGVRHGLAGLIAVAVSAVIAGARSYAAIGEWAADLSPAQRRELGLTRPDAPNASTFRRALSAVDAALLDTLIGAYLWTRTHLSGGRRVIAIDGKTLRGARTPTTTAPHLVAAFDHATGAVVGQLATAAKATRSPPSERC